jgi:hypothetical protein
VTSTPHPSNQGGAPAHEVPRLAVGPEEKLGIAAEYLATQVASKKADAILPAVGAKAARLARALRPVVRSMVRVALVAGRGVVGKADRGGTAVEDER